MVTLLVTAIVYLSPIDPTRLTFGQRTDQSTIDRKKQSLGLDNPLWVQMGYYLNDLSPIAVYSNEYLEDENFKFLRVFGISEKSLVIKWPYLRVSYQTGRPVSEILWKALPNTFILASFAMVLGLIFGLSGGILSALFFGKWQDKLILFITGLGYSTPGFIVAVFFAWFFGFLYADAFGLALRGSIHEMNDFGEMQWKWSNLILPAMALGIRPISMVTMVTRSSILESLSLPHLLTAEAKGLSKIKIWKQHILKVSWGPIVSAASGWMATLLTGSYFVESVFQFKGVGDMIVRALISFDLPVLLGGILFSVLIFNLINILTDYIQLALIPKLRD
jgi:peptide/nickel transport system permease protein